MHQCSKCRDSYIGTPTDDHQCYKQMSVDVKFCLDAKLLDECKTKPNPLYPGQTVKYNTIILYSYLNLTYIALAFNNKANFLLHFSFQI